MSDPESEPRRETPAAEPPPPSPPRRLPWLLLPLGFFLVGGETALPGLDMNVIASGAGSIDAWGLSLFSLALTPITAGYALVELTAALVPAWRPARHTPRGRARLTAAALVVSLLLAVAIGWSVTWSFAGAGALNGPWYLPPLSLAGVTTVLWLVIHAADRKGVGSSLALLLGLSGLVSLASSERLRLLAGGGSASLSGAMPTLMLTGLAAVATVLVLRTPAREPGARAPLSVRTPPSGLLPFFVSQQIIGWALPLLWSIPAFAKAATVPGLAVPVGLAVVLPWIFYSASRVAAAWARLFAARDDKTPALAASTESPAGAAARVLDGTAAAQEGGEDSREGESPVNGGPAARKARKVTVDTAYAPPGEGQDVDGAGGPPVPARTMADWTWRARALRRRAMLPGIAYLAIVAWPAWPVLDRAYPSGSHILGVAGTCLLVAAVFDIVAEARFRRAHRDATAVLSEQRLYVADAALVALAEAGIPAFARSSGVRALLSFFGPFAPIEVLVPAPQLAGARERLAAILEQEAPGAAGAQTSAAATEEPAPKKRVKKRRKAPRERPPESD